MESVKIKTEIIKKTAKNLGFLSVGFPKQNFWRRSPKTREMVKEERHGKMTYYGKSF